MLGTANQQHQFSSSVKQMTTASRNQQKSKKRSKNQVLVRNAESSASLSQETLQVPANNFRCKEK